MESETAAIAAGAAARAVAAVVVDAMADVTGKAAVKTAGGIVKC